MAKTKTPQRLAKTIAYILERRPDEFGLVLDKEGYVKVKDLLKALNEEKGWKHVRRFHLDEILYSIAQPPFEISDNRIRAIRRAHLPRPDAAPQLPKLLYTSVRRKAYPYVAQNGISPGAYQQVALSASEDLAVRMGRRSDAQPVLLTVNVQTAIQRGVLFQQIGELLFLAPFIPPDCFQGPPLPKEKPRPHKQEHPSEAGTASKGTFTVSPEKLANLGGTGKDSGWKEKKERHKKHRRKRERPPWRR